MQKLRMTNIGQALVTKLVAGTSEINFTKIKTSDHVYQVSDIAGLTDLDDVRQTVSVSSATIVSGNVVRVRATVNNTGATTGYWVKAVGLYAMDEAEEEEILFGVSLSDNAADYIPPQTVTTTGITYTMNCRVGNTEYVDVTVDPAAVVAEEDFEELTECVIDVENILTAHKNGSMMTEVGQHGVRYYGNMLQYYDVGEDMWRPIVMLGVHLNVTAEPNAVVVATHRDTGYTIRQLTKTGTVELILPWMNYWDITAEKPGLVFSTYSPSYSTSSLSDMDSYKTCHVDSTISNNKIYGFTINLNESDPDLAVTYTDDAVGIVPGNGWDDEPIFSRIRPVLYDASVGKMKGYLNPNNYAQFEDGTPADIYSGEHGDVFVDFPVMYMKVTNDTENNTVTVKIATSSQSGFTKISRRLVTAYLTSVNDNKMCSLSGKSIYKGGSSGLTTLGVNIDLETLTLLRHLFILKYKSLNSKAYIGKGYIGELTVDDDIYSVATATTGGTDARGMNYGTSSTSEQNKFCGLEDIYGNVPVLVDKIKVKKSSSSTSTTDMWWAALGSTSSSTSSYSTLSNNRFCYTRYSDSIESAYNGCWGEYNLKNIGNVSSKFGYLPTGLATGQDGSASTYFCDPVRITQLASADVIRTTASSSKIYDTYTYGTMYFGMMTCANPDDPEGDRIVDENVGLFSMEFVNHSSTGKRSIDTLGYRRMIVLS